MKRMIGVLAAVAASGLFLVGCSSDGDTATSSSTIASAPRPSNVTPGDPAKPHPKFHGWDIHGNPINGGPVGADGSTGNNLTHEYCARHQDPGCPAGSYVGPNAQRDPKGGPGYVPCEGTICTNPNHGAGNPQPAPRQNQQPPQNNNRQAPPEPGQNNFRGPNGNQGGNDDQQGPPEPGQNDFQGPNDDQGPPEPGQDNFQGPGGDQGSDDDN
ncbi:hypothetical protein [Gordonia sp. X0973]|uniref:hypothetical protein n=1 Tax=Gordonia sp. X0973 TaxID=2742602 RepID=UPI0026574B09|nr:hypothetical protein [Gordonia sp. X0973]